MRDNSGDKIRLQHILNAINEIESYLIKADFDSFISNSMMRFACVKQLEIIGEASNHISNLTKGKFTEIEWKQITGLRNVLIHEYFGIDAKLVWQILNADIPILKTKIESILQSFS